MPDLATTVLVTALASGGVVLAGAALHDVAARTVPNGACLLIALAGLVARLADGTVLMALAVALAVFVVAALLWRRGYMGGGDVKLFGAVALLVPPSGVLTMLTATALAGGVLAVVYLVGRAGRRRRAAALVSSGRMAGDAPSRPGTLVARVIRAERWRMRRGSPMPYAVAIACGTFYALSLGGT